MGDINILPGIHHIQDQMQYHGWRYNPRRHGAHHDANHYGANNHDYYDVRGAPDGDINEEAEVEEVANSEGDSDQSDEVWKSNSILLLTFLASYRSYD